MRGRHRRTLYLSKEKNLSSAGGVDIFRETLCHSSGFSLLLNLSNLRVQYYSMKFFCRNNSKDPLNLSPLSHRIIQHLRNQCQSYNMQTDLNSREFHMSREAVRDSSTCLRPPLSTHEHLKWNMAAIRPEAETRHTDGLTVTLDVTLPPVPTGF